MEVNSTTQISTLRLKDVYDLASEIASEFEKIVSVCGSDNLRPVVLKVIHSLECLEATVLKLEDTEKELDDLKVDFKHLESKKASYQEEKLKLIQELEKLEENWMYEVQQLKALIKKLQEDKQSLQSSLDSLDINNTSEQTNKEELSDENLIEELQSVVAILSSRLEGKDKALKQVMHDHEALKHKVEYLNELNKALRLRFDEAKMEVRQLWRDRTDLEFQVESYELSLKSLQDSLNESSKQTMDLEEDCLSICGLGHAASEDIPIAGDVRDKMKYLIQMQETLQERVSQLEAELSVFKQQKRQSRPGNYDSWDLVCQNNHNSFHGFYGIRHVFQLFLGMLSFQPCNFRPSLNQ